MIHPLTCIIYWALSAIYRVLTQPLCKWRFIPFNMNLRLLMIGSNKLQLNTYKPSVSRYLSFFLYFELPTFASVTHLQVLLSVFLLISRRGDLSRWMPDSSVSVSQQWFYLCLTHAHSLSHTLSLINTHTQFRITSFAVAESGSFFYSIVFFPFPQHSMSTTQTQSSQPTFRQC